jgi:hypothetical protein
MRARKITESGKSEVKIKNGESAPEKAEVTRKRQFPSYEVRIKIKKQASRGEVLARIYRDRRGPKLFWDAN